VFTSPENPIHENESYRAEVLAALKAPTSLMRLDKDDVEFEELEEARVLMAEQEEKRLEEEEEERQRRAEEEEEQRSNEQATPRACSPIPISSYSLVYSTSCKHETDSFKITYLHNVLKIIGRVRGCEHLTVYVAR
jgi:hypothetical protein